MNESKALRSQSYIFKRYIWLMSLLYDYGRLSYEEISQKWMRSSLNEDDDRKPLPKRTFHDHVDAIAEIFDVIITNDRKGDYKYYIENAEDLGKDTLRNWMLSNFSMSNALADSADIRDRIILQDIPSSFNHHFINTREDRHSYRLPFISIRPENHSRYLSFLCEIV